MSTLIIVESPAKARTIQKYLGDDFEVLASMGHVRDLPQRELGVDLDSGFEPKYVTIKGKGKIIKEIRAASKKADKVLLAPDPDREGEAIAWHIAEEIRPVNENIQRVLFHEITKSAIGKALEAPFDLDMDRFNAQQARRVLDRLVGYLVSPILWKKVRRGLSAGRVQSVAVRLIVEREEQVEAFDPVEYWDVAASLQAEGRPVVKFKLAKVNGKKPQIGNEKDAMELKQSLDSSSYKVANIDRKEVKRRPSAPYITSTLQQDGSRMLRFTSTRTMQLAQRLYEGIDLGEEGPVALITYMRTDSVRLANEAVAGARDFVAKNYGNEYLPEKPLIYRSKKRAQEAHEAIRPTSLAYTPERVRAHLTPELFSLYRLIWTRFIACQMVPSVYEQTTVTAQSSAGPEFTVQGRILRFDGYRKALDAGRVQNPDDESKDDPSKALLPEFYDDETLKLVEPGVSTEQQFTKPPSRFTEATLIRTMEEQGIGRPSTYASIIRTITDKANYVSRTKGSFHPTELGRLVTQLLIGSFPEVLNVTFTANMEDQLDRVEEGDESWNNVLELFFVEFSKALDNAEETMANLRREGVPVSAVDCSKCSSSMVLKAGSRDLYLACSNYPDCSNMTSFKRTLKGVIEIIKPESLDRNCPDCEAQLVIREGRFGRFVSCTNYPECKFTESLGTGIKCGKAKCAGELVEKRTRKGKIFYACNKYPDCDFATWDRPLDQKCPECKHHFLLEKTRKRGTVIICGECDYTTNESPENKDAQQNTA
jgi:DNA topoisomerase-1